MIGLSSNHMHVKDIHPGVNSKWIFAMEQPCPCSYPPPVVLPQLLHELKGSKMWGFTLSALGFSSRKWSSFWLYNSILPLGLIIPCCGLPGELYPSQRKDPLTPPARAFVTRCTLLQVEADRYIIIGLAQYHKGKHPPCCCPSLLQQVPSHLSLIDALLRHLFIPSSNPSLSLRRF